MAKRRAPKAPAGPQELPTLRQQVAFGSTATAEAFTSFSTGLNVLGGQKMAMLGAYLSPWTQDANPPSALNGDMWFSAVLLNGEKTAKENANDGDNLAYFHFTDIFFTSGRSALTWPVKLYQPSAKMVYGSHLTLMLTGSTIWNSVNLMLEIVYLPMMRHTAELEAHLLATGNLS